MGRNGSRSEFPVHLPPLTWRETRSLLRADRLRLLSLLSGTGAAPSGNAWLHPSFVCVALYRISNHFYRAKHKYAARFFWHLNVMLTGADISPPANLGAGLVVLSPPGTAIMGTAGRNLTVMPLAGIGSELGRREDIGAGPGMPLIGDDVILEPNCGVLGPIRVGNRVRVRATCAVTRDVPDDCVVDAPEPRFLHRRDME